MNGYKIVNQKLACIHLNPVKNGIADAPENYIYSSVHAYLGLENELNVMILDFSNTIGYVDS